jgi:hypothetical protein
LRRNPKMGISVCEGAHLTNGRLNVYTGTPVVSYFTYRYTLCLALLYVQNNLVARNQVLNYYFKKLIAIVIVSVQVLVPSFATASQYLHLVPVKDLRVTSGGLPPAVNVDTANTSSSTTTVGTAVLKAAPSTIDFGSVSAGEFTSVQTITLSNLGGGVAVLGALSVSNQFWVSDNCNGAVLPSLGVCQVNVAFSPTEVALGGVIGSVFVPVLANGVSATAMLTLTGVATASDPTKTPAVTLIGFDGADPSMSTNAQGTPQISFADALAGLESATKYFSVQSSGTSPVSFNGITLSGDTSAYAVTTSCPAVILVGDGCAVTVTFSPSVSGLHTATLTVQTSAIANNNVQVVLSGTGTSNSAFSLSASQVALGSAPVGASLTRNLLVLNTGTTALTAPNIAVIGSGFSASHDCPPSLAMGLSCSISVTAQSRVPASLSGTLSVGFDEAPLVTVPMQATLTGPVLAVDGLNKNFGEVTTAQTATQVYTVSNVGNATAPLTIGALSNSDVSRTTDCAASLEPNAVCHITITYSPTGPATLNGNFSISSALNSLTLSYQGTAVWAYVFDLSATVMPFASVPVASTVTQALTVTNPGNLALGAPTISVIGSGYDASTNCTTGMAAGQSCTVLVSFNPTARNDYLGTLTVSYPDTAAKLVSLSGTGVQAELSVNAQTQGFGTVYIGDAHTLNYVLTNIGNIPTGALTVTGLPNSVTSSHSCGATIAAGASCTVSITYTPLVAELLDGNFTMTTPESSLQGYFTARSEAFYSALLSASSLEMGPVSVGASKTLSVLVTNSGGNPLTSPDITVDNGPYAVTHNCPATLSSGNACSVNVTFVPTGTGTSSATVLVDFAETAPSSIAVTGSGSQGILEGPATLSFGSVGVGATKTLNATFTNTGNAPLASIAVALTGSDLSVSADSCSGVALGAGASCTVSVLFAPASVMTLSSASLSVTAGQDTVTPAISGSSFQGTATGTLSTSESLNFSITAIGAAQPTRYWQFTSGGTLPLTVTVDALPSGFSVVSNTCVDAPSASTCRVTLGLDTNSAISLPATPVSLSSNGTITSAAYSVKGTVAPEGFTNVANVQGYASALVSDGTTYYQGGAASPSPLYSSTDLMNWSATSTTTSQVYSSLVLAPDGALVRATSGNSATQICRSVNAGASWTNCSNHYTTVDIPSLVADPARGYLYAAFGKGNGTGGIKRSLNNGVTWTSVSTLVPANSQGMAYLDDAGNFVFAGTTRLYMSTDGGNTFLSKAAYPAGIGAPRSFHYVEGTFWLGTVTGNLCSYSMDLNAWSCSNVASGQITGFAYGNGVYVMTVAQVSGVYVSTDLVNWSQRAITGSTAYGVRFIDGYFWVPTQLGGRIAQIP